MLRWNEWINNGWVRLALADGQELRHRRVWDNGEGYSCTERHWHRIDDVIYFTEWYSGSDCDGPYQRCYQAETRADELEAFTPMDEPHIRSPQWRTRGYYQRDEYAEAAGY